MTDDYTSSIAVERLTGGIGSSAARSTLISCLTGLTSPAAALMHLLIETRSAGEVRAMIDEITQRAAAVSRATDSLLRDRVDELTQLVVENELGCEKMSAILRAESGVPAVASVSEGVALLERLFDWSPEESEEASRILCRALGVVDSIN